EGVEADLVGGVGEPAHAHPVGHHLGGGLDDAHGGRGERRAERGHGGAGGGGAGPGRGRGGAGAPGGEDGGQGGGGGGARRGTRAASGLPATSTRKKAKRDSELRLSSSQ